MTNGFMLIGIPGAGKSTYARKLASKYGYKILSNDDIRDNITAEMKLKEQKLGWRYTQLLIRRKIKEYAVNNIDFVVDGTNVFEYHRKDLLQIDPENIKWTGIVLPCEIEVAKERVKTRKNPLPYGCIENLYKILMKDFPQKEEGFVEIKDADPNLYFEIA